MTRGLPRSLKRSPKIKAVVAIAPLTGTPGTANDAMTALTAATAASTDTSAASLASVNAFRVEANNNFADLQAKVNAIIAALKL